MEEDWKEERDNVGTYIGFFKTILKTFLSLTFPTFMLPFISTPGKIFIKIFLKDIYSENNYVWEHIFLWGRVKEQCF